MLFALLSILKTHLTKNIITSFLGSYAFVRGISIYAGGFPSELKYQDIFKGESALRFYIYLVGIVFFTVLFTFHQVHV